ncbi:MAG: UDP-N-acetylglucosamine 1-carboxyvinyltransferase [Paracoccaceae bacterium]
MDAITVTGGRPLSGEIAIAGAKNAALALMPATLLSDAPLTLTNAPRLSDMRTMSDLLASLGTQVTRDAGGTVIGLHTPDLTSTRADYAIVSKMRASNLVLGPLLARAHEAVVSLPGGCAIGTRPMDIHIDALTAMGATIELRDGYLHAAAPGGLRGARVPLAFASVGATENVLMAATLARGTTVIENAAREPEIVDLATCLRAMGARIEGDGTAAITVEGVEALHGATHRVVADRIELGTYMLAPVIAGGSVTCTGADLSLLSAFADTLRAAGAEIVEDARGITVSAPDGLRGIDLTTAPHPGYPTDLQAQMMAAMCTATGSSHITEAVFENRFMHVPELTRMGARIDVHGGVATVTGVDRLRGAPVMASDLRASASLILAGLAAEGTTKVARVYHLDRGYESMEGKLAAVGADIQRISE